MDGDKLSVGGAYHHLFCEALGRRYEHYIGYDADGAPVWKNELEPALERQMWEAILAVLRSYVSDDNLIDGNPRRQFPTEVAGWIGNVLECLLVTGRMPATLQILRRKTGASKYGPVVIEAIKMAVLYTKAARAGVVKDRRWRQTILYAFGISGDTYKEWQEAYRGAHANPDTYWPDPEIDDSERAQLLINAMWKAARGALVRRPTKRGRGGGPSPERKPTLPPQPIPPPRWCGGPRASRLRRHGPSRPPLRYPSSRTRTRTQCGPQALARRDQTRGGKSWYANATRLPQGCSMRLCYQIVVRWPM